MADEAEDSNDRAEASCSATERAAEDSWLRKVSELKIMEWLCF